LKGIGFSFFKSDIPFHGMILGGAQQGNLRSGTENVQGIHSIHLALTDLVKVDVNHNLEMRSKLLTFMKKELNGIGEVIDDKHMASNTIYFYLNHYSSDIALALFDVNGIEISAGSACSSGAAKASAILLHKGLQAVAKNGLRLSMGLEVSEEFLNKIEARLHPVFNKLAKSGPGKQ
jgi:cysteine desulfurase